MVANYTIQGGKFAVHSPRPWLETTLADTGVLSNFDLAPDGRRFVVLMPSIRPEDQQTVNHATFVLNFFDEVRRRVASAGR
jgi:serine/threonine-protein kinase